MPTPSAFIRFDSVARTYQRGSSVVPARRAARIEPIEALRHA